MRDIYFICGSGIYVGSMRLYMENLFNDRQRSIVQNLAVQIHIMETIAMKIEECRNMKVYESSAYQYKPSPVIRLSY